MAPQNLKQAGSPPAPRVRPGRDRTRVRADPHRPGRRCGSSPCPACRGSCRSCGTATSRPSCSRWPVRRATLTRVVHVVGKGESDVAELVEPIVAGPRGRHAVVPRQERGDPGPADRHRRRRRTARARTRSRSSRRWSRARGRGRRARRRVARGRGRAAARRPGRRSRPPSPRPPATSPRGSAGSPAPRTACSAASRSTTPRPSTDCSASEELLDEHGPVSGRGHRGARAAARERFGADWGIGVTGVAGPEPQNGLPVGTCFWALAHPDGHVEVHGRRIPGDRGQVIARLGTAALDLLRRRLLETAGLADRAHARAGPLPRRAAVPLGG
jgi:nicotinamide-nucleotide amidase